MTIHEDINKIVETATKNEVEDLTKFFERAIQIFKKSGLTIAEQNTKDTEHARISTIKYNSKQNSNKRYAFSIDYYPKSGRKVHFEVYDLQKYEDVEFFECRDDDYYGLTRGLSFIEKWSKKYNK